MEDCSVGGVSYRICSTKIRTPEKMKRIFTEIKTKREGVIGDTLTQKAELDCSKTMPATTQQCTRMQFPRRIQKVCARAEKFRQGKNGVKGKNCRWEKENRRAHKAGVSR